MTNLQNSIQEVWKDVANYEGLYAVSNLGRVKSCSRIITADGKKGRFSYNVPDRILKHGLVRGYHQVVLQNNSFKEQFKVHRLVATYFVEGYFKGAHVNHKDGNKLNNICENLEWCNEKQNTQHAVKLGLMHHVRGENHQYAKKVLHLKTGTVYPTIKAAAAAVNICSTNLARYFRNPHGYASEKRRKLLREFVLK